MRFANKLEFGEKTHEVSMTAQRLVQRMKKDSIHSGRRPSGLCGAALLLAARMHDYNRTPMDVVKIVKIHESTLRKRLLEFGDTPSSVLTIDEFMTVDLEAEQDPPAFKAARKKDKEMIQKLAENDQEFSDLQREIEAQLEKDLRKNKRKATEATEGGDDFESTKQVQFITESTISTINECLISDLSELGNKTVQLEQEIVNEIAPDIMAICNQKDFDTSSVANMDTALANLSNSLEELDDDELNSYILTEDEAKRKNDMWKKLNAEYLTEKEAREERLAKEREEGKPEKKRRKTNKKRQIEPSTTAGEAIEKMLQEKKISNKINYDILKSLTDHKTESVEIELMKEPEMEEKEVELTLHRRKKVNPNFVVPSKNSRRFGKMGTIGLPVVVAPEEQASVKETETQEEEPEEQPELEIETEREQQHTSLAEMLNNGADEEYYGLEEEY